MTPPFVDIKLKPTNTIQSTALIPTHEPRFEREPSFRRLDAFEAYALFRSMPTPLRYPPKDKSSGYRPTPREFALSLGIEDESVIALLELKTQKNFAEHFGITEQTLGRWNKILAKRGVLDDARKWANPLSSNVLFGLYRQIMGGKALPQHYRLWFEVVCGWRTKKDDARPKRTIKKIVVEVVDPRSA